jgi:hypothetical protein
MLDWLYLEGADEAYYDQVECRSGLPTGKRQTNRLGQGTGRDEQLGMGCTRIKP